MQQNLFKTHPLTHTHIHSQSRLIFRHVRDQNTLNNNKFCLKTQEMTGGMCTLFLILSACTDFARLQNSDFRRGAHTHAQTEREIDRDREKEI